MGYMISFKASFLNNVSIQKRIDNKNVKNINVPVFELHPDSLEDYNAIRQIGRTWEHGASFAGDLFDNFARDRFCKSDKNSINTRYFAICSSKNIDSDNILGVASLVEEKNNTHTLKHLQTNPLHKHGSANREYFSVGQELVKMIQKLPNVKEIFLYAGDRGAEIFYEKLNFKLLTDSIYMHFKR